MELVTQTVCYKPPLDFIEQFPIQLYPVILTAVQHYNVFNAVDNVYNRPIRFSLGTSN